MKRKFRLCINKAVKPLGTGGDKFSGSSSKIFNVSFERVLLRFLLSRFISMSSFCGTFEATNLA